MIKKTMASLMLVVLFLSMAINTSAQLPLQVTYEWNPMTFPAFPGMTNGQCIIREYDDAGHLINTTISQTYTWYSPPRTAYDYGLEEQYWAAYNACK